MGMKWFKFGIQEKTALLVMAVAVTVALGTSVLLQRIASRMIQKHEIVDLGDEANLRAWQLVDRFYTLRGDARNLTQNPEFRQLVYSGADEAAILEAVQRLGRQPEELLSVEIRDGYEPLVTVSRVSNLAPQLVECRLPGGSEVIASPIQRIQADVGTFDVPDAGDRQWITVIQSAALIRPPDGVDGTPRVLSLTMRLEPFSSPRHLFFVVDLDHPSQPYVMHPDMGVQNGFGEEGIFQNNIRREFLQHREAMDPDPANRIERVALLEGQPLNPEYTFYFLEGVPRPELKFRLDMRRQTDPEVFTGFMDKLSASPDSMARHLGGLGNRVEEVRILTRDPADLISGEGSVPSFRDQVDQALAGFAGLPADHSWIQWMKPIPCRHCHISCIEMQLDTSSGPRRYLMMYAAFQEEFVGSIRQEIHSHLIWWVVAFGLIALVVASLVSVWFIQPLRQMTRTAQHVLAEEGALHERISGLSANLPDNRRDEVGDIAKASKRLFDEVIANQEHLERRVSARTAELEAANRQLEGLAREKDAFLANVSHELRTPMTAVSGNLQLLKRRVTGDREIRYVDRAMSGVKHLETLIDEILDFQKIIMGGISVEPENFELPGFIRELQDSLLFQARKNQNRLDFSVSEELDEVCTDRQRLRQVLTNLVSNACKFTNQGVVTLTAESILKEDEEWLQFRIRDTGRGMNEDEQKRLFTRFYTNKKSNETGAGLGLVICEGLCELMGGSVILECSEPGKGSVFLVELPRSLKSPQARENPASE